MTRDTQLGPHCDNHPPVQQTVPDVPKRSACEQPPCMFIPCDEQRRCLTCGRRVQPPVPVTLEAEVSVVARCPSCNTPLAVVAPRVLGCMNRQCSEHNVRYRQPTFNLERLSS